MAMQFLSSYLGMYLTQAVLHSLISVTMVEFAFFAWRIQDHHSKFRYRLLSLTLPVVLFPAFQFVNPERGSVFFRYESALFNSHQWLSLSLFGIIPLNLLFLAFLALISLIFLCQEILPILKSRSGDLPLRPSETDAALEEALEDTCADLSVSKPAVVVIDEDYPVLFTEGTMNHTLVISRVLLERLSRQELMSALLHELIHMKRGSSLKTQLIYILRMLMFFNPFSLVEFRRIVHDDEFICDSMAIAITRDPAALVRAIEVFISPVEEKGDRSIAGMQKRIEAHSHNALLSERIEQISMMQGALPSFNWIPYVMTAYAITQICYMVV